MLATSISNLRIATRQSQLALWQANYVRQLLQQHYPNLEVELVPMVTSGDRTQASLVDLGGKALFVKELQTALLTKKADIAVHSIKDLSAHDHADLCLAAICEREDPRDVMVSLACSDLTQLPFGATVGTSSPRRQCQLMALRPDLIIHPLRGNVDTRIRKAMQGECAAILLAAAGLHRLQLQKYIRCYLDPVAFIPAIAQGAIGIECCGDNVALRTLLAPLDHLPSHYCVTAERAVNQRLNGDCVTPLGAFANLQGEHIQLIAMIGGLDGKKILRASLTGPIEQAKQLGFQVAEQLLAQGAAGLLN